MGGRRVDNWADRLEAWLGRAWEGRRRGRRGGFQPVQVGRALEAELLAGRRVSILQTYVPNRYRIFLHPQDWEELRPIQRTLTVEMIDYLRDLAQREGYAFVSPPQLEWEVADDLAPGRVRVEARFQEPESATAPPAQAVPPRRRPEKILEDRAPWMEAAVPEEEPFAPSEAAAPLGPLAEELELTPPGAASAWGPAPREREEPLDTEEAEELVPATGESTRRYRATPEVEAEPSGRLVVVEGPERGTSIPLRSREILIGRATDREPAVHVALSDRGVSRRHARLLWRGGFWWLEDLGSTNGTYVNGEPVDGCWLQAGDRVEVGSCQLVLEAEAP